MHISTATYQLLLIDNFISDFLFVDTKFVRERIAIIYSEKQELGRLGMKHIFPSKSLVYYLLINPRQHFHFFH